PVCSPDYLRSAGPVTRLRDLARRTLIHLEEPYRPKPAWRDWFAHHGFSYVDNGEGLRLNDYALVVQAAIGSQGIAMGWAHIVDYPLRQGLLLKAMDAAWRTGQCFYVVSPRSVTISVDTKLVRDWIVSDAELTPTVAGNQTALTRSSSRPIIRQSAS
ncbi:MAG: LysR substrate-binding domain-containing protein, partial [Dongiaceae bacterium]